MVQGLSAIVNQAQSSKSSAIILDCHDHSHSAFYFIHNFQQKIIFFDKMARRYDTRTTIFSPEGRLYQVEYAMEAIGHAGTCLGMLADDGILLVAERRNTNKVRSVSTDQI